MGKRPILPEEGGKKDKRTLQGFEKSERRGGVNPLFPPDMMWSWMLQGCTRLTENKDGVGMGSLLSNAHEKSALKSTIIR